MDEFDYVVVGGGTAGAVVAARLSEDPTVTVCVLEAGPSDVGDDSVLRLERWMALLESGYDWDYPVEPQVNGNSFLRHARAKVLGGCSSHNSCIAFWAPAEDLDEWGALGCTGWSAEACYPLYRRLESNDAPGDHHGRSGPVTIRTIPPDDPCGRALLAACADAGIPTTPFNTGSTVVRGAHWFQINAREDGTRSSASVSYLHPILGSRPNLEIRTGLQAERLLFDESNRCAGVAYLEPDTIHSGSLAARREVVVSCGAIDSPKLLMLSGIGPAGDLRECGVDVRVDSPGVGSHLQDHPEGVIMWEAKQPMVTRSTQWWEIGIFTGTEPGLDRPDLMFHYGSVPFDMNTYRRGYPTTDNAFCLTPNVTRARSMGTVRLRTRDFRDKPKVDPRYFTDEHDIRVMVHGLRLAREITAQAPMAACDRPRGLRQTSDSDPPGSGRLVMSFSDSGTQTSAIGRYGLWNTGLRDPDPARAAELAETAAELEQLGYGALWLGGSSGIEHAAPLIEATSKITVATGILSIWQHEARETADGWAALEAARPGRFLLGLGVSHAKLTAQYKRPYGAMVDYLDALDAAGVPADRRVLAALGPRMLELSRDRAAGAHPYLVTPEHTAQARATLGQGPLLAPEFTVVLEADPELARATARETLALYLQLANYTNSWLRLGFTEDDFANGGSDRLVDALFGWGDEQRVRERIDAFLDAGADHVAVQVLSPGEDRAGLPREQWRRLAAALEL